MLKRASMSLLAICSLTSWLFIGYKLYNTKAVDCSSVTCVYPISKAYRPINRLVFYFIWIVAFAGNEWTPFAVGAMVWSMLLTVMASMNSILIVFINGSDSNTQPDVDIFGTWSILSIASTCSLPLTYRSPRVRNSKYRPIFALWSVVVIVGVICSAITMFRTYPLEQTCAATNEAQCSYPCIKRTQMLHNLDDMEIFSFRTAFDGIVLLFQITASFRMLLLMAGVTFPWAKASNRQKSSGATTENKSHSSTVPEFNWRYHFSSPLPPTSTTFTVVSFSEGFMLLSGRLGKDKDSSCLRERQLVWTLLVLTVFAGVVNEHYERRWTKRQELLEADKEGQGSEVHKEEQKEEQRNRSEPCSNNPTSSLISKEKEEAKTQCT